MNRKSGSKRRSKRRRPGFWTDFNCVFEDASDQAATPRVAWIEAFKRELREEIKSGDFARALAIGLADEVYRLKGLLEASKARKTTSERAVGAKLAKRQSECICAEGFDEDPRCLFHGSEP